jgi:hypothetical protein
MRKFAQPVSWLSLAGILGLALAYLSDRATLDTVKLGMLVCTIVWFVTTPLWMGRKDA